MDAAAPAADAAATASEQIAGKSGACVQCVERCQREHHIQGAAGHFSSAQPLHPCFLRTVMEHNLRSNMAIPKAFVQMHGNTLPGSTVDLEGVNGKVWLVTVVTASTGTAVFRFGWHVFSADNNLKVGDSLLFTMVAKNRFTVRVFSKNGMESLPTTAMNTNLSATFNHNSSRPQPPNVGVHFKMDEESDEFVGTESDDVQTAWGAPPNHSAGEGVPGGHGPTIQEIIREAHAQQATGEPIRRRRRRINKPQRAQRHTTTLRNRQCSVPGNRSGRNDAPHNRPLEDPRSSNPPHLPDLNDKPPNEIAVKPEPTTVDANPQKRKGLQEVLQERIRSGQYSKRQREDNALSRKIREEGMQHNEDEKPDIKPSCSQFKQPRPHNLSMPASVKVKTEPMYVVKTEDMSTQDMSTQEKSTQDKSNPVAVYTRRSRKEGSTSHASGSTEKEGDERIIWYPVLRMVDKRERAEKEFLVEISGTVPEKERSSFKVVEQDHDAFWWVPGSHFSTDLSGCYFC